MPTHPVTSGSSYFILNYSSLLKQMGHDVYFLYIAYFALTKSGRKTIEQNIKETQEYWGENFFLYRATLYNRAIEEIIKIYRCKLCNHYVKCDDRYLQGIHKYVNTLHNSHQFDACIINYYWLSKLLVKTHIRRKAIMTHDSFTFNNLRNNIKSFFNLMPNEEAKALQRCPFIFAMQKEEQIFFQRLAPQNKVLLSYCNYHFINLPKINNHNIVMLSGSFYANKNGVDWFIKEVFPLILNDFPDCRLKIGGALCNVIGNYKNHPNIDLIGLVDNAIDLYKLGDVAINPTYQGTGLKIKTFESIAYNKITIVHPHSTIGIYDKEHAPLFASDNPNDWVIFLHKIWDNPEYADDFRIKNQFYISRMNQFITNQLNTFLNS